MPTPDVVAFITEPPSFTVEAGLVHITQRYSDNMRIERVMPMHVFLKTIALAQKAVREYEAKGTAEVIPFPRMGNGVH